MTRKIVDHVRWKANVLYQSADIKKAILVCSQTTDASWLDWQQAEWHTLSADEGYILSVVEGWLKNG